MQIDKTIVYMAIDLPGMPKTACIPCTLVLLLGYIALPASVAWYFISDISALWMVGGLAASYSLIRLSRELRCIGIREAAFRNEELYVFLLERGAFLFGPDRA
ncbi:hypothetical protein dsx2_3309 [Desulfovibrio sp. X2]|uniref:hypothetical protein n=1 Tax=Desulfovibrio sp. X2 TaxID=941449 RepID=UPI000358A45E|nr:hypothetical protein [Desulfovibrio sp. X2]EPR40869.1 hypothetical protein dsx2_3309 [Desulfovibrio sp. X2]